MRVRIHPTGEERWRVPITIDGTGTAAKNPLYDVQFTYEPVFSFKVKSTLCPMSFLIQKTHNFKGGQEELWCCAV